MTVRTDPALTQRILSDNAHQPLITPTQWIVHTAVDGPGPTNLGNYFETGTALESHEWLRWDRYEQFIWYDRSADANYKVNHWYNPTTKRYEGAISTETEDDGDPIMRPWNAYQLKQLIRGGVWKVKNLKIPPRLCRSVHDPGMGWHSMYPNDWTNVPGKTCPGSVRIRQFKEIVLPGIQKALAVPTHILTEDEELMANLHHYWLKDDRKVATPVAGVHLYGINDATKTAVHVPQAAIDTAEYISGGKFAPNNEKTNPLGSGFWLGWHIFDGPLAHLKK